MKKWKKHGAVEKLPTFYGNIPEFYYNLKTKNKSPRFVLKWGEKIEKENDEMFDSWDRRRWI